jgi:hypothetical protein
MNWYYIQQEHEQRRRDWQEAANQARLASEVSEKRPIPAKRLRLLLIFASLGHWLIWRR